MEKHSVGETIENGFYLLATILLGVIVAVLAPLWLPVALILWVLGKLAQKAGLDVS